MAKDDETLEIEDFSFKEEDHLKEMKTSLTKHFFYISHIICILFCLVFLWLLIFSPDNITNYFIGFIGAIIGYFLAKRPYEL